MTKVLKLCSADLLKCGCYQPGQGLGQQSGTGSPPPASTGVEPHAARNSKTITIPIIFFIVLFLSNTSVEQPQGPFPPSACGRALEMTKVLKLCSADPLKCGCHQPGHGLGQQSGTGAPPSASTGVEPDIARNSTARMSLNMVFFIFCFLLKMRSLSGKRIDNREDSRFFMGNEPLVAGAGFWKIPWLVFRQPECRQLHDGVYISFVPILHVSV